MCLALDLGCKNRIVHFADAVGQAHQDTMKQEHLDGKQYQEARLMSWKRVAPVVEGLVAQMVLPWLDGRRRGTRTQKVF